jgi:glycine cleavage system transcriptional repressor
MKNWYMLTLVGEDRPGIVAAVTSALYEAGGNLGEASMMRLGGNFTIMLMVQYEGERETLEAVVEPAVKEFSLHLHLDSIVGSLHHHLTPDVRITVFGADRAGIVARVTKALAGAGFNILDLESDVAGREDSPIYIMHIEGQAREGIDALRKALDPIAGEGVEVNIAPVDMVLG